MNDDIQIAGRSALRARLSFTWDPQVGASFNGRQNIYFHLLFALETPRAPAFRTRMLHDATSATTRLTGSRHGKESLLITDLAGATAVGAVFRLGAVRRSVSLTAFAGFKTRNAKLSSHSVVGIFERNLEVVAQVSAALRGRPAGASPASAKDVIEPKKVPEDIFNATETGRSPGLSGATGYAGMSKVIVTLPLGGVSKHTVGF